MRLPTAGSERLSVEQLADVARVGPRQIARQFTAENGETPARAVERLRCEAALPRTEGATEPLDQIAFQVGFGDLDRMRKFASWSTVNLPGRCAGEAAP